MFLTDLNDDELIVIFRYCAELDHANLARVCKLFEAIIEAHFNEMKCRNLLMVTHVKNYPAIFERTFRERLKYSERLRIYQNWVFGSCQQLMFFQHRENYLTHLELDSHQLYTASLGEFNVFRRKRRDGIDVQPIFTAGAKNDSLITSMKRRGEMVAGSRANGSLFTYTDEEGYNMEYVRDGRNPITDMDFIDDLFVTTTKNDTSFHRLGTELDMLTFDTVDMNLNVGGLHTVNFNPTGEKILGTHGASFNLIDAETGRTADTSTNKSQIYKTLWISESTFLYTSWNNPLSLIDTRKGFERLDFSCGNFTATAIDFDGRYGAIYGTLVGMMILCDLRNVKTFERVFHLDTPTVCRRVISDELHLYASTDNAIFMLNFD
jgi:hypothetical protein